MLIIPNSKATLKGVLNKTIIKMFGPEIHNVITKCFVHKRELAEKKHVRVGATTHGPPHENTPKTAKTDTFNLVIN